MARLKLLNDSCLPSLQPLYESAEGPSLAFLAGISQEEYCRAWCLLHEVKPIAAAWYSRGHDEAELIDLRVIRSRRRQGVGRQLLWATLSALASEGINKVGLEVRASNKPAIALYEAMGFVEKARRTDYYLDKSGREDAILMSLELTVN